MGFFSSLKDVCKVIGKSVTGGPAVIKLAEDGIKAHQQAKQTKRERRLAALSALAATFKPIVLAGLVIGVLAYLFFAPHEAKKSLIDFIKFFTG